MVTADRRVRYRALGLVCLGVFAALFARLWYLQVLNAPAYEEVAARNSTRTVTIPAPRGRILDRNGQVLVDNAPTKVVTIDRQKLDDAPDRDAVISRVAALLNHFEDPKEPYTAEGIEEDLAINQVGPFDPVPLAENVSDELLVELVEHQADYPGVVAETRLLRQYHYGRLAAQVLGRVGPIPEQMWEAHADDADPYPKDAQVGLSGVEQAFEEQLRGVDGERVVEVTPAGRIVRTIETVQPEPGNDVQLTLDIDAQAATEAALAAQVEQVRDTPTDLGYPPVPGAAAMLMDPATGQVVSMASYPTFDPTLFVPAISEEEWRALQHEDAHAPLTNRAVAGLYAPGSTFKLISATAALQHGIVTPDSIYVDNGYVEVGGTRFWNDRGEGSLGPISLPRALTQSSNVYFYNIGQRFWEGRGTYGETALQKTAEQYGFGQLSGIDLPDEKAVPIPTPERLRKLVAEYPDDYQDPNWYTGTSLNLAIGQGDMLATPLQIANAYGQFANGGDRYRPTLLLRVLTPFAPLGDDGVPTDLADIVEQPEPAKIGHVALQPAWHAAIMQGLAGVTQSTQPHGTASDVFAGFPFDRFPVAGKTGTSQTGQDASGRDKFSHALFVGFGPTEDARYVGIAVLEEAGYGSSSAAPVVRAMLEPVAATGGWPTVEPTIPFAPPPPGAAAVSGPGDDAGDARVPAGAAGAGVGPDADAVTAGGSEGTTETTTPGAVAAGGR